ncbi:MAG: anhydro-N-acetylmuramic acid kinase [Armatimonadota bacterium]|nr:anhydro-N-acetylmuramic acid kinase [Armatimonadota bacterium]
MVPTKLYGMVPREASLSVIGLMAGTSMDGIDAALVRIVGSGLDTEIEFRGFTCQPYPREVRERLMRVAEGSPTSAGEISELNFVLGNLFTEAAFSCAASCHMSGRVDLIASHGQTIFHHGRKTGECSTLQIGEAAIIAERTGVPVVSDFRPSDIAAGGEGAPLVAYFDYVFLRSDRVSRAVQNIGGIANVTYLPAGAEIGDVVAFDTGPGNMLIDAAVTRFTNGALAYDRGGEIASSGRVVQGLLEKLKQHPYYKVKPPKTTGREQFGAHYLEEVLSWNECRNCAPEDVVATLTALTAETIAISYQNFLGKVDEVILCGGGAANPTLVDMIKAATKLSIRIFDEFGIPSDAKEAVAFALLGSETIRGIPSNVPKATGAAHRVIMGKISLPYSRR